MQPVIIPITALALPVNQLKGLRSIKYFTNAHVLSQNMVVGI